MATFVLSFHTSDNTMLAFGNQHSLHDNKRSEESRGEVAGICSFISFSFLPWQLLFHLWKYTTSSWNADNPMTQICSALRKGAVLVTMKPRPCTLKTYFIEHSPLMSRVHIPISWEQSISTVYSRGVSHITPSILETFSTLQRSCCARRHTILESTKYSSSQTSKFRVWF